MSLAGWARPDQHQPVDRSAGIRPAPGPGAPHGPDTRGGEVLRPGRAGPQPPGGFLVVHPHDGAHRRDQPGLCGHHVHRVVAHGRRLRGQLSRDASCRRRHVCAGRGNHHLDQVIAPAAAVRVLAPASSLRLSGSWSGTSAPALDRQGLPHLRASQRTSGGPCGWWRPRASLSGGSANRCGAADVISWWCRRFEPRATG